MQRIIDIYISRKIFKHIWKLRISEFLIHGKEKVTMRDLYVYPDIEAYKELK